MACLTPGLLSNLFDIAAGNVASSPLLSSSHRSPLLQVIEIIPCLSDNQWRSERFFVKVSDSRHAAYVSVSAADDADLIRSDEIQLGQLVYIRGGLHIEKGCPVPVIRGLKPIPKRRLCIGNPSDLFSNNVLLPFTQPSVKKMKNLGETTRRLSFDSPRRGCWDKTPPPRRRDNALLLSSPRFVPNLVLTDKGLPKNETPLKHFNCDSSALRNRNGTRPALPVSITKPPKDGIKSLSKTVSPVTLFELPSGHKTWSDQRISWGGLPETVQVIGKKVSSRRQVAVSAAVSSLEEASAMESVLLCLQSFAELCDSSKKLSVGQVVQQFLGIYHSTQKTGKALHVLLTSRPHELVSNGQKNTPCKSAANKNAASWVQVAIVTGFSPFNLFKDPKKEDDTGHQERHYIVTQNSSEKLNPKTHLQVLSKTSPRNAAYNIVKSPPMKHCSVSERSNLESKNRLKESANLADELVRVSSQWFLKYLENSLNKGLFLVKKVEANGKESLLVHLKGVNRWLDDLIVNRLGTNEKVEDIRKKLQRFLLKHIESSIGETR